MNETEYTTQDKEFIQNLNLDRYLDRVIEESHSISSRCKDYTIKKANDHNMKFTDSGDIKFLFTGKKLKMPIPILRTPTNFALGQLCNKIGVPYRYLKKCIDTGKTELASENISSWLHDYNKDLFIRTYKDKIRGILTPRYSCCDSPDILEVVDSCLPYDFVVAGHYLSEERLHLRVREQEPLNIDGEDLYAGLTINSSDVGRSILSVKFLIYKMVCSNGLMLPQSSGVLFEQRHTGITPHDFKEGLENSIEMFDSVKESATKLLRNSIKEGKLSLFNSLDSLIDYVKKEVLVSEKDATEIVELFNNRVREGRYRDNNWGLINSITEYAQKYTLEKRIEMEHNAGNLLIA